MATVKKTLSKRVDANGSAQVFFYIVLGRNGRIRVKSGVTVPTKHWNEKKEIVSVPQKIGESIREELKQKQEKLDIALKRTLKIIDIYQENATKDFIEHILDLLKDFDGTITYDIIENALADEKEQELLANRITVFDVCETYLAKGLSESLIRVYRVLFRSMARYQIYRNKILRKPFAWYVDDVLQRDIEQFFDYLAKEHVYREKHKKVFDKEVVIYNEENKAKHKTLKFEARGENYLIGLQKKTKSFWNWLIKTKRTTNNPFIGIEIAQQKYGTPYYITKEERNIIAEHDFSNSKHLEVQRDIFIFQCLTGCRVGDLTRLMPDNVVNGVLVYTPHKTKDEEKTFTARVPLSEKALELINKYRGKDSKGRLLPFISDQKYNEAIKAILKACEITRMVNVRNAKTGEDEMKPINELASSHMARRTFVGNAHKQVKDPNLIGRMSGHVEGSRAFARYRDIDDDMLKEVINAIQ